MNTKRDRRAGGLLVLGLALLGAGFTMDMTGLWAAGIVFLIAGAAAVRRKGEDVDTGETGPDEPLN